MKQQLWALHDHNPLTMKSRGCFPIDEDEAWERNTEGFGIFSTVNEFIPGTRKISTLRKILAFGLDLDDGTKHEQLKTIMSSPLVPSWVIETKRGHQLKFFVKDGDPRFWNSIILDRLVPFFGADKRARDIARILRVENYFHNKDPKNEFRIRLIHQKDCSYTMKQIAKYFPDCSVEQKEEFKKSIGSDYKSGKDFFDNIYNLDHEEVLNHFSGTKFVNGEEFSFHKNSNGNKNILVNGKSTSTWLDKSGRIGSLDNGGPTIIQWLMWYGISKKTSIDIVKKECAQWLTPEK